MSSDEEWFEAQGFLVDVEEGEDGRFWTHLVRIGNPAGRAPDYGQGVTRQESVHSARRRYEIEQLGLDPSG